MVNHGPYRGPQSALVIYGPYLQDLLLLRLIYMADLL